MESELSRMIFSVPATKGIEFGAGFDIARMTGHEANDEMYYDADGKVKSYTNNNGGITGGITNGMPISFKVAIKPPASIEKRQKTVNLETKMNDFLEVRGRHDPVIVPRAVVDGISKFGLINLKSERRKSVSDNPPCFLLAKIVECCGIKGPIPHISG